MLRDRYEVRGTLGGYYILDFVTRLPLSIEAACRCLNEAAARTDDPERVVAMIEAARWLPVSADGVYVTHPYQPVWVRVWSRDAGLRWVEGHALGVAWPIGAEVFYSTHEAAEVAQNKEAAE